MNADVEKAVGVITDHIADLTRCIGVLAAYPEMKPVASEFEKATKELAPVAQALRDQEVEIAGLRANYEALVIRLGEVTTKLEAAKRDAARYRWLRGLQSCPFAEADSAWDGLDALDSAVDSYMEAMRDSAREGGE